MWMTPLAYNMGGRVKTWAHHGVVRAPFDAVDQSLGPFFGFDPAPPNDRQRRCALCSSRCLSVLRAPSTGNLRSLSARNPDLRNRNTRDEGEQVNAGVVKETPRTASALPHPTPYFDTHPEAEVGRPSTSMQTYFKFRVHHAAVVDPKLARDLRPS